MSTDLKPHDRETYLAACRMLQEIGEVHSPAVFKRIIHAAPTHLVPLLAISAFSGIRMAELNRLDWKAVDLDRRIIEVRAGQAKTASRRVIPISENLAAWLTPLERKGKIVRAKELQTHVPALARALKIEWPRNVLRHSFISYRIAVVQSADQVALEAGNSPSIIFQALPGTHHPGAGGKMVGHHAEEWPVGEPVFLRPQEGAHGAQWFRGRFSVRNV